MYTLDTLIPVKRLRLDRGTHQLQEVPEKAHFLRGPIPMGWLEVAAKLPGKTLHVAMALQWLAGMSDQQPFKVTQRALDYLSLSRDALYDGLDRLEQNGLIQVQRNTGSRPTVSIIVRKASTPNSHQEARHARTN